MKPENRQGWTRTALAVGIVGAYIATQFVSGATVDGLKELAFIAVTFYFTKNDN